MMFTMKLLHIATTALLVALCHGAPTKNNTLKFDENLIIYRAEYDVINILIPLNAINENVSGEADDKTKTTPIIFFILADTKDNQTVYKGLYIRKRGIVTKLLDNGKDMTAEFSKDVETAYFAATDGVYSYNAKENKAEKYGNITDDFTQIAKCNASDVIYVLNKDHILYKLTELGTKIEKISEVVNANEIMLDHENNLFYTSGRNVYVFNGQSVKKVVGLPDDYEYMKMIRPPFILPSGMPVVVNDKIYIAYVNGTGAETSMSILARPSAYSVEGAFVVYFGFDKKIYEYNIIVGILNSIFDGVKESIRKFLTGGIV